MPPPMEGLAMEFPVTVALIVGEPSRLRMSIAAKPSFCRIVLFVTATVSVPAPWPTVAIAELCAPPEAATAALPIVLLSIVRRRLRHLPSADDRGRYRNYQHR